LAAAFTPPSVVSALLPSALIEEEFSVRPYAARSREVPSNSGERVNEQEIWIEASKARTGVTIILELVAASRYMSEVLPSVAV
jgi:hypothetical protein